MKKYLCVTVLVILLFFLVNTICIGAPTMHAPIIVASTTMIGALLKDIGGDYFNILVLIPPTSCPGHFDLKPNDVQRIKSAELIVCHFFQKDLQIVLKRYVKDNRRWIVLSGENSMTIPKNYMESGDLLLSELSKRFSAKSKIMKMNWEQKKKDIIELEKKYRVVFKKYNLEKYPVIAAYRQKEFLEYFGFRIIGYFDKLEGETMEDLLDTIKKARSYHVKAVIGNVQNGDKQASFLSEKLGIPLVMLSNFPGNDGSDFSYRRLLDKNCSILMSILQ